MSFTRRDIRLNEQLTQEAANRVREIISNNSAYDAAKLITREFLGSRKVDSDKALFGFWVPGLVDGDIKGKENQIKLELYTALNSIDFPALKKGEETEIDFQKDLVQLAAVDNYMVGVVENVSIGTADNAGSLYWLRYFEGNTSYLMRDPLVESTPLGVYAPAELFDIKGMLDQRADMDYYKSFYKTIFEDGSYRARDVGMHIEIHPETATEEGTIKALTERYKEIGKKIQANLDAGKADMYDGLSPADLNFVAFDSIELTPEVPPVERESVTSDTGEFFHFAEEKDDYAKVLIKRPDISNWGYDTPIIGSAAVNPSILTTLRPNEFLEFIETIHTLPGRPIQMCIDSVLGHCDFQGARLLETFDKKSDDRKNLKYINSKYFRGPNMYGRDIDFAEPNVKAILLEMLKRKLDLGYDCVRVDGAQDFIIEMDEETGLRIQDDEFLNEMSNVVQDINGLKRRLDMNLEDGRPWPDDLNWLYNSKYLDHCIERTLPFGDRVKQWSPIIFAHNVHGKYKWFMNKWDRFVEVFRYGENWITGHSNHDNARYFYRLVKTKPSSEYKQGDSFDDFYNDQLGKSLKDVAHHTMDNNALTALSLGFLPGNPMFLLNALFHTPWLFLRDIDDTYDVKIVAEEGSRFLTWYVDKDLYNRDDNFVRLKALGFDSYAQLVSAPKDKEETPGFMDILFEKCEAIKTDALMARYLFDDPNDAGGYETVEELKTAYEKIINSRSEEEKQYIELLTDRINVDKRESDRRVKAARKLMKKTVAYLSRDKETAPADMLEEINNQLGKLAFLDTLEDRALALLIEHADYLSEYNPSTWAKDERLTLLAPQPMKPNGRLTATKLKEFSRAFMLDARDSAKVHKYEAELDPKQAKFNFDLRIFRQRNPWLLQNPTNDVQKDYFSRKLFINGAKEVGDWGDKGDVVKCNTVYYGWRTSPCGSKQVFFIGNMEGKPIDRCPLNIFLNLSGKWEVVAYSPTMKKMPAEIDKNYVLEDFKNGEALVLQRYL